MELFAEAVDILIDHYNIFVLTIRFDRGIRTLLGTVPWDSRGYCDNNRVWDTCRRWVLFGRCLAIAARGQSGDCCSKHRVDSTNTLQGLSAAWS